MSEAASPTFQREYAALLAARLDEPRRFLHVVAGPRQVGKTTMVEQVLAAFDRPSLFVSADEPALHDAAWLSMGLAGRAVGARPPGGEGRRQAWLGAGPGRSAKDP